MPILGGYYMTTFSVAQESAFMHLLRERDKLKSQLSVAKEALENIAKFEELICSDKFYPTDEAKIARKALDSIT
jgi:hypothetical protein